MPYAPGPMRMQSPAMSHGSRPQSVPLASSAERTLSGQQTFAAQPGQAMTGQWSPVLPGASHQGQVQTVASSLSSSGPASNTSSTQRSLSIQSAQTMSSVASHRSSPQSVFSVASPTSINGVSTPSTIYSPVSQVSNSMRRPSVNGSDLSPSYFSLCSSCKLGNVTSGRSTAECAHLMSNRSHAGRAIL